MNAATKMLRARSALVTGQPFFGCLALQLTLQERPDITDTMATDGHALFYCAAFVDGLTEPECMGGIAHEVLHCAYGHHCRLATRDLATFNEAADYCVNRDLLAAHFVLPDGLLLNSSFDGMGAEEIYSVLAKAKQGKKPGAPKPGNGAPSQGAGQPAPGNVTNQPGNAPSTPGNAPAPQSPGNPSTGTGAAPSAGNGAPQPGAPAPGAGNGPMAPGNGAGGNGAPGNPSQGGAPAMIPGAHGIGGIIAPAATAPADIAAESDRWQIITRQAVAVAKAHNAGTVPGYLTSLVTDISAPRADFRDLLANWMDSRVASDYSFMRPNRRFLHTGIVLPGAVVDGLEHVVFAVDTSGSITGEMIDAAASEIVAAMESGKFQKLTVIMADTRVCSVEEFTAGDDVKLTPAGGGGTAFSDTFRWIDENASDASAVVYLTDLYVSDFGRDPGCPVLWATHGDSRAFDGLAAKVPFGEAVYIGRL